MLAIDDLVTPISVLVFTPGAHGQNLIEDMIWTFCRNDLWLLNGRGLRLNLCLELRQIQTVAQKRQLWELLKLVIVLGISKLGHLHLCALSSVCL